jgi:hypothetical protein
MSVYKPVKDKEKEELKRQMKELEEQTNERLKRINEDFSRKLDSIAQSHCDQVKRLQEELGFLKQQPSTLKETSYKISPQEAQKELDKLIEQAKTHVKLSHYEGEEVCPRCREPLQEWGCGPSAHVEGDYVIYGVHCNNGRDVSPPFQSSRGFHQQGKRIIPKYIREHF